jgi:hypothetical protein
MRKEDIDEAMLFITINQWQGVTLYMLCTAFQSDLSFYIKLKKIEEMVYLFSHLISQIVKLGVLSGYCLTELLESVRLINDITKNICKIP